MSKPMTAFNISAVVFQEGEWWSAQCLEYEITAQAKTLTDLRYELERVLVSQAAASIQLGQEPFEGLGAAPQKFWSMFENAKLRLEGDDLPFRLPRPMSPIVPKLRIAELVR